MARTASSHPIAGIAVQVLAFSLTLVPGSCGGAPSQPGVPQPGEIQPGENQHAPPVAQPQSAESSGTVPKAAIHGVPAKPQAGAPEQAVRPTQQPPSTPAEKSMQDLQQIWIRKTRMTMGFVQGALDRFQLANPDLDRLPTIPELMGLSGAGKVYLDSSGIPRDSWGSALEIVAAKAVEGRKSGAVVRSAGPDRLHGSADDLRTDDPIPGERPPKSGR